MRTTRVCIKLGCCLLALAAFAWPQAVREAGLWEMTTTVTFQQSPLPPGVTLPPSTQSPFGGGATTTRVCLTQAMIDKYGAPMPQTHNNGCQITNIVLKSTNMTADLVCSGKTNGTGTIESSWARDQAKGKIHFTGTVQAGPNTRPIEWTIESHSVFKGADCGDVKPLPMPDK